ncbi:hypothetical protein AX774_g4402 [Zancudomyces culisetae]|uniref:CUE domain-containing protein n=1 Tax=Zancudomyces culisetae TaxID=1213189 RepID=A0A1R1PMN0_ZANCU|nr:hypothetical protein AX774_g4402 [Zancudomyces culisetae]|eukprot:OMH82132.1 hypothetical protein AX774_g4402 [Zancudomyces culisetae]
MDASCLSITQAEFERNLEMAIWEIETEKKARIRASSTGQRSAAAAVANNAANRQKLGYFGTFLDEEATERGAWLLEKGSSLAKSTIAKTNQFVERVINELSSLDTPSNSSSPIQSSQLHTASTPSPNTNTNPNANLNPNSNSTAPEFSETLALVCDMFPTFDKEVCEMVLQANDGFVPQTIEQLLEMGSTDPLPPANEAEFMQPEVLEGGQAADDGTGSMHEDEGDDWRGQWADDDSSDNESDNDESPDNDHDSSSQHHVQGGKESKS